MKALSPTLLASLLGPRLTPRWRVAAILTLLLTLLGPQSAPVAQQEPAAAAAIEREVRLWLEVADARGRRPDNLQSGELSAFDGGQAIAVSSLGAPHEAVRVALYLDPVLARSSTLRRGVEALSAVAAELVGLGEVEIVVADPEPETLFESRDSLALGERLSLLALQRSGRQEILELRRSALAELAAADSVAGSAAELVRAAIDREIALVRRQQSSILAWAGDRPARGPRLLVLVQDGFDLDPFGFWAARLSPVTLGELLRGAAPSKVLSEEVATTARALSALGWTVLPLVLPVEDGGLGDRFSTLETTDQRGESTVTPGVTVRPGELLRRRRERREARAEEAPTPVVELVRPLQPLRQLAIASGGEVVESDSGLRDALRRLDGRLEVVYNYLAPADGELRRVEVTTNRPGLVARSRRWAAHGTPLAVSRARMGRLLAGSEAEGGLDVAAVLRLEEGLALPAAGDLEARVSLKSLAVDDLSFDQALLRVTVAVALPGGEPWVRSELLAPQDLRGLADWYYRTAIELPGEARQAAVLVEDLDGGLWGGSLAAVVAGSWAEADEEFIPPPTVIEILRPEDQLLRGRVKFDAEVYDPKVVRVVYLLDEREVAERDRAPFGARIGLGRNPHRRTLTAVAYDARGDELGRDSVVLNAGGGGLAVDIVRPSKLRGTGPIEFEASVTVPLERQLDRVLFFWNNRQVATLYRAPFVHRVVVPENSPVGYVRVVALLDDGSVAEDVVFVNGPEASEQVNVNLVELNVVVTDRRGRPVRGLKKADFRIREEGVEQRIASFSDASELPLTLGMAIDSSASMFVKLPLVQQAAARFLQSTFTATDRAFLVDFDSKPRLARGTTGDLSRMLRAIDDLSADGRTALWESVVFSLVQLQGVRGRKALVVFSDGADEDDEFPFRSCLRIAKRMGVPVYLILMKHEPQSDGLTLFTRSFTSRASRLVESVGGRLYYAKDYRNLDEVYEDIEQELRSQYLLTYYPSEQSNAAWRDVDIEVAGRGLTPRTLAGYWQ